MELHLTLHHSEYAHPGKLLGLPLPYDVAMAAYMDAHEEEVLGVPVREWNKAPEPPNGDTPSTGGKHKSMKVQGSGPGGKRVHMQ
jgi:hypothetical protein